MSFKVADECEPIVRTIPAAARMLGLSTDSVRRRIRDGELPVVNIFGRPMVRDDVIRRIVSGKKVTTAT